MSVYLCPFCKGQTTYQAFSGGREWYCGRCDTTGEYGEGDVPRRVQMLRTEDGRKALREEMDRALALLSTGKDAGTVVRELGLDEK